jgi:hypothetical protein
MTLRPLRVDVDPGHPLLVRVASQITRVHDTVRGRGQSAGDTGALAEVVVIRAGSVALDIGTCRVRCAAVELHPAMHLDHHRLNDVRRQPTDPKKCRVGRPSTGDPPTDIRSMRAARKRAVERNEGR